MRFSTLSLAVVRRVVWSRQDWRSRDIEVLRMTIRTWGWKLSGWEVSPQEGREWGWPVGQEAMLLCLPVSEGRQLSHRPAL